MQLKTIQARIYTIRGHKVMLDFDLAELYGTETKVLKQSVKRNSNRFPADFMFVLTKKEFENLRSQFVTSKSGGNRYMSYAFTEQGVAMLASILNSPKAILVNIQIVRAFVLVRQFTASHIEFKKELKKLEVKYNRKFKDVYEAIGYLLKKDREEIEYKNRKRIGFKRQDEKE